MFRRNKDGDVIRYVVDVSVSTILATSMALFETVRESYRKNSVTTAMNSHLDTPLPWLRTGNLCISQAVLKLILFHEPKSLLVSRVVVTTTALNFFSIFSGWSLKCFEVWCKIIAYSMFRYALVSWKSGINMNVLCGRIVSVPKLDVGTSPLSLNVYLTLVDWLSKALIYQVSWIKQKLCLHTQYIPHWE